MAADKLFLNQTLRIEFGGDNLRVKKHVRQSQLLY